MSKTWRNTSVSIDTEDKMRWCREGEVYEQMFVEKMNLHSYLTVQINPEKNSNPMAPDLLVPGYGLCDLKAQRTPFFTASRYNISPDDAITLNIKDVIRYRELYPEIGIFFWINWQNNKAANDRFKPVKYKWGVYFATIGDVLSLIDNGIAKTHEYQHRKQPEGEGSRLQSIGMNKEKNATKSFVLDCNWLHPVISSTSDPWQ
ncbi:hypothetical protein [Pseudomonas putida]|uniref:Uncharacterized protein n=1 Tax=Pseudomonas putida TaxID=303 RepID=A0A8I1EBG2_PSEPU|nr:hypothetical protein [Pseudomonas putida]MBI6882942.1 hypothetical protein [Pseudomonas putida]